MSLRICILEADDLHPELRDTFVGFGQMFKQLFSQQDATVECQIFNVVKGEYPAAEQEFDAYLVTGSKADSFADDPWIVKLRKYLRQSYAQGKVLLGICFGHQVLALALGGKAQRSDKGWGIGMHRYRLQQRPSWLPAQADEFQLLISHRDQVTALPAGASVLASSAFCENAAFVLGQQVLCFQGHPEFTHDFSSGLLKLRESIYCPQLYQAAQQSLSQEHDGQIIAQWMLCFIKASKEQAKVVTEQVEKQARESLCSA